MVGNQGVGADLVPHLGHHGGPGSDEPDASLHTGISKVTPLGKEAITRMDGVNVILLGQAHNARNIQVGSNWSFTLPN